MSPVKTSWDCLKVRKRFWLPPALIVLAIVCAWVYSVVFPPWIYCGGF
jgi:hypothetical protein